MKISNMDGDWQKKKLQGVCGECQSPVYSRVGCTPSEVSYPRCTISVIQYFNQQLVNLS